MMFSFVFNQFIEAKKGLCEVLIINLWENVSLAIIKSLQFCGRFIKIG